MTTALLKAYGELPAPMEARVGELGLTPEESLQLGLYFNAMLRDAENRWRHDKL